MPLDNEVSLRQYIERLLEEHDKQLDIQFAALDKALMLAREQQEKQFHILNELRKEVTNDRSQFVMREVHETKDAEWARWRQMMTEDYRNISGRLSTLETRIQIWAAVFAALFVIGQFAVQHFLR